LTACQLVFALSLLLLLLQLPERGPLVVTTGPLNCYTCLLSFLSPPNETSQPKASQQTQQNKQSIASSKNHKLAKKVVITSDEEFVACLFMHLPCCFFGNPTYGANKKT